MGLCVVRATRYTPISLSASKQAAANTAPGSSRCHGTSDPLSLAKTNANIAVSKIIATAMASSRVAI